MTFDFSHELTWISRLFRGKVVLDVAAGSVNDFQTGQKRSRESRSRLSTGQIEGAANDHVSNHVGPTPSSMLSETAGR